MLIFLKKTSPFFIGIIIILISGVRPCCGFSLSSGEKAYEKGDYEKAEKYFEEKIKENPNNKDAQYNLGNTLYQQERFDEAAKAYEKSVEKRPDFADGWYNLGVALAQQNKYQDAIDAFGRALKVHPADKDTNRNLEYVKKKLKEKPKADKSDSGGKYREGGKDGNSPNPQATPLKPDETPLPKGTPPPPKKKDEKEDENSKNLRSDPDAKRKMKSDDPSAKFSQQQKEDQQRQEQAKKELGLNDKQIQNLMAQMQQQEEMTQQYYSANPKKELQKRRDMWNFLPREQQKFMKRFFGKPEKDQEVEEDW